MLMVSFSFIFQKDQAGLGCPLGPNTFLGYKLGRPWRVRGRFAGPWRLMDDCDCVTI